MKKRLTNLIGEDHGHAVIEVALLSPWIFLLFMALLDFGFYAYSIISVENAARVAALYTSSSSAAATDQSTACFYVLQELSGLANARSLTTCGALPLVVTATSATEADGTSAARVTVQYQSPSLIPIPWLPGQYTVRRSVDMMVTPGQ